MEDRKKNSLLHILATAELFESDNLSFEEAILFFKYLAICASDYLEILPLYYRDIIRIMFIRGNFDGIPPSLFRIENISKIDKDIDIHSNPLSQEAKTRLQNYPQLIAWLDQFPYLSEAINLENNDHAVLTSPFVYLGNKSSIVAQIFPRLKFQPTFVDMFGGSGVVSLNVMKGEEFMDSDNPNESNQKVILFEFTPAMANVLLTMAHIEPEISFHLINEIVNDYDLREAVDENVFRKMTAEERVSYALEAKENLLKLAQDFFDYEEGINAMPKTNVIGQAYYDLMYLAMYRFKKPQTGIKKTNETYKVYATGDGFKATHKFAFLLNAYRFFMMRLLELGGMQKGYGRLEQIAHKKWMDAFPPNTKQDLKKTNVKSLFKSPKEGSLLDVDLVNKFNEVFKTKRKNASLLNPTYMPKLEIRNDSSIGTNSSIQTLLKPFTDLKDRKLFYADPPYLASSVYYDGGWDNNLELELLKTLDTIDQNGHFFALSNVTDNKGYSNYVLKQWLIKKKNVFVSILPKEYAVVSGASIEKNYVTIEILATNYEHEGSVHYHDLRDIIVEIFKKAGHDESFYDHFGVTNELNYTLKKVEAKIKSNRNK